MIPKKAWLLAPLLIWGLMGISAPAPVQAQESTKMIGTVVREKLNVRAQPKPPAPNEEPLYILKKGQKVTVLGKSNDGKWFKISFPAKDGSRIEGWVSQKVGGVTAITVTKKKVKGEAPPPAIAEPVPTPAPIPAPAPETNIPDMEAPPAAAPPEAPAPKTGEEIIMPESTGDKPPAEPAPAEPAPEEAPEKSPAGEPDVAPPPDWGGSEPGLDSSKLEVKPRLGLDLGVDKYALSGTLSGASAKSSILKYDLWAVAPAVQADAYFLRLPPGRGKLGVRAGLAYGIYNYTVGLKDASGASLTPASQSKSGHSLKLRGDLLYRLLLAAGPRPPRVVVRAGYEYYKFDGGDLTADSGPLYLIVDQTIKGFPLGFDAYYPFSAKSPWAVFALFDYYLLPKYSETGNHTGTDPSAGLDLRLGAGVEYRIWRRLHLNLGYSWKHLGADFKGAGRRILNDFTNASVKLDTHQFGLGASYLF